MTTRETWKALESIHTGVYFASDVTARYEAVGLKGYWMGYFAGRSAALGTPPPELVIATFHGFAPRWVHRALPDAWAFADREDILAVRYGLAHDGLARVAEAATPLAEKVAAVIDGIDWAGKPLAAAHASLPAHDDPLVHLWQSATTLREYRGDCHLAVLTSAGLDGVESNALSVATGWAKFPNQRELRGWTEDEWQAGIDRLATRGWLTADGSATEVGRAARIQLEDATDRVADAGLNRESTARLVTLEAPLVDLVARMNA